MLDCKEYIHLFPKECITRIGYAISLPQRELKFSQRGNGGRKWGRLEAQLTEYRIINPPSSFVFYSVLIPFPLLGSGTHCLVLMGP